MTTSEMKVDTINLQHSIEQLVTFEVDHEEFAIPIADVYQIIFIPRLMVVPNSPETVKGIMNLRNEMIPVLDARTAFGLPSIPHAKQHRIIVIQSESITVGLVVDRVIQVLQVNPAKFDHVPSATSNQQNHYLETVYKTDERIIMLLNVNKMLNDQNMNFIRNHNYSTG
ncbi:chemotaxis protein CheW [Paenibacillus sp. Z6-24]